MFVCVCVCVCVCVAASCAGVSEWIQSSVCGEGGNCKQRPASQRPWSHSTGVWLSNEHILLSSHFQAIHFYTDKKCIAWMLCKSLWIKASAKCINVNVNVIFSSSNHKHICSNDHWHCHLLIWGKWGKMHHHLIHQTLLLLLLQMLLQNSLKCRNAH